MSREKWDIVERFLECQEELESRDNELQTWTDSLEDLSEIEKAFEADKLHGKTILDIGTDCVKPLYIALKYEPDTIIGINEDFTYFPIDIEQKSRLFTNTDIKFYECSCFNNEKLNEILTKENQTISDFVLLSKTLHHLRTGKCIAAERNPEHICQEDEDSCVYRFDERETFKLLLGLGKRLIVYECFLPGEDPDKVRGRGGHFTIKEWKQILRHLAENYRVELIQPLRCSIDKEEFENVNTKLRQVDCICFYVEKKKEK